MDFYRGKNSVLFHNLVAAPLQWRSCRKPDAFCTTRIRPANTLAEHFQRLMADSCITCSVSRSGNFWDNAATAGFFSSLKTERTAQNTSDQKRGQLFVPGGYHAQARQRVVAAPYHYGV